MAGLYHRIGKKSQRHPSPHEVGEIKNLFEEYFRLIFTELILDGFKDKYDPKEYHVVLSSRFNRIIRQVNSTAYPFQLDSLFANLYSTFDGYFLKTFGFTTKDAVIFSQKIQARYSKKVQARFRESKEARLRAEKDLNSSMGQIPLKRIIDQGLTKEEALLQYFLFLMYFNTQELFVFDASEFCREENVNEIHRFENFLQNLSCCFCTRNKNYESPLDQNDFLLKPILKMEENKYFCPLPHALTSGLPEILDNLLRNDKNNLNSFNRIRSSFCENASYAYFKRVFPESSIFRKLKYYNPDGTELGEIDLLIKFDNKILLVEAKSGNMSENAEMGNRFRLKVDLKKLIEDAFRQLSKSREFIKANNPAVFKDEKGNVVSINWNKKKAEFLLVNVTLESLFGLAAQLKELELLGLFEAGEYPWSVNLHELDIITSNLSSPTMFLHYVKSRLAAQRENIFHVLDELTLLVWYFKSGTFLPPTANGGKTPDMVSLDGSFVAEFDNHYLYGKEPPRLKIQPEILRIVKDLESSDEEGYTLAANSLLDLDHENRDLIVKHIQDLVERSKENEKRHNFTIVYKKALDMGLTFMTRKGGKDDVEIFVDYCQSQKNEHKMKKWTGFLLETCDGKWRLNCFLHIEDK